MIGDVWQVPCPTCAAPVGARCHLRTGRVTRTHRARIQYWLGRLT